MSFLWINLRRLELNFANLPPHLLIYLVCLVVLLWPALANYLSSPSIPSCNPIKGIPPPLGGASRAVATHGWVWPGQNTYIALSPLDLHASSTLCLLCDVTGRPADVIA